MDKKLKERKNSRLIEFAFGTLVIVLFGFVAWGLFHPAAARLIASLRPEPVEEQGPVDILPVGVEACPLGETEIRLADGLICRPDAPPSVWREMYDTYPLQANGKERIFLFFEEGDLAVANQYLNDLHFVPRYEPAHIPPPITWTEDPYRQSYWRFIFYSLRSTKDLLYAWETTGDPRYQEKHLEILKSFLDTGMSSDVSWEDNHAVAFRTMVLVNAWWRLREHNALPVDVSTPLLQALQRHGAFLADRQHYEPQHNHGLNEAAALYLLAVDFPDIPGAAEWRTIAEERINTSFEDSVDESGVLVENSPFYHFYVLEKYWEILQFMKAQGIEPPPNAQEKLRRMISYAAYVIQPNGEAPLLGASLATDVNYRGVNREIAEQDPEFLYVVTKGKEGKRPSSLGVHYDAAGQTIMRSDWGTPETFEDQTQVIFDVGAYRTDHSDLDALSFNLYGKGITLMPDSGLYTYDEGPMRSYFKGTSAHNTVVVDGRDQVQGSAIAGTFHQGNGYASQSAEHQLYRGVSHQRAMALLGERFVLIVDRLKSDGVHDYDQMFHLFPGAIIKQSGLDITGYAAEGSDQQITIHQLLMEGLNVTTAINETDPPNGVCSNQYQALVPCYAVAYSKTGTNVEFVTLLEIGKPSSSLKTERSSDGTRVTVIDGSEAYEVDLSSVAGAERVITVRNNQKIEPRKTPVPEFFSDGWVKRSERGSNGILSVGEVEGQAAVSLESPPDGTWVEMERPLRLDLSNGNLLFRMKLEDAWEVENLELTFSNRAWAASAEQRLLNSFKQEHSDEWLTISLGKGELRDRGGHWAFTGRFDWSQIDRVKVRIKTIPGKTSIVRFHEFAVIPMQAESNVIVIFDDGASSITPAIEAMNRRGLKANIAVISGYTDARKRSYLSLREYADLQNKHGWTMINHTWTHKDAVKEYSERNDLAGFEEDLLKGIEFLRKNGINTNPNWYIPPHGAVDSGIKDVIGKYYKFSRLVMNAPEVFPFGDPLAIKAFSVEDDIPAEAVIRAIQDAEKYKLTLFLTFHRIKTDGETAIGYPMGEFNKIADFLVQSGIRPKTLNEFDQSYGISTNELEISPAKPEQIGIRVNPLSPIERAVNRLRSWFPFGSR